MAVSLVPVSSIYLTYYSICLTIMFVDFSNASPPGKRCVLNSRASVHVSYLNLGHPLFFINFTNLTKGSE